MNKRIKKIRSVYHLTQAQLAKSLSLSWSFIAQIETNKRVPSDRVIQLICLKYNVNETWLRNGDGNIFADPKHIPLTASKHESFIQYALDVAAELSETNRQVFLETAQKLIDQYPIKK